MISFGGSSAAGFRAEPVYKIHIGGSGGVELPIPPDDELFAADIDDIWVTQGGVRVPLLSVEYGQPGGMFYPRFAGGGHTSFRMPAGFFQLRITVPGIRRANVFTINKLTCSSAED